MQGNNESVGPLAGKIRGKGRICIWIQDKRQGKPVLPLSLVLKFRGLLEKEFLRLIIPVSLKYRKTKRGSDFSVVGFSAAAAAAAAPNKAFIAQCVLNSVMSEEEKRGA